MSLIYIDHQKDGKIYKNSAANYQTKNRNAWMDCAIKDMSTIRKNM